MLTCVQCHISTCDGVQRYLCAIWNVTSSNEFVLTVTKGVIKRKVSPIQCEKVALREVTRFISHLMQ